MNYSGRTALITGASSGIGEAFARALAERGMGLALAARNTEKLGSLAQSLRKLHGVAVEVIPSDLCQPGAAARLHAEVRRRGLEIDWLVNNAGVTAVGRFDRVPLPQQSALLQLNVVALTELAHLFAQELVERKGAMINVASLGAFQPDPYYAVYGASKAYVLNFSEALWAEYRGVGLRVLAVCPGLTQTNIFEASGNRDTVKLVERAAKAGLVMTPEEVVAQSLRALEKGRSHVVTGLANRLTSQLPRIAPRAWMARAGAALMKRSKS
ncbi:MAG TPA: SDR family oxidoreductase [Solimonas sp.]|nr:SDR family oxidoreductase [Solimonas sp.]